MAGKLTVNPIQINDSATATNNFVLKADNAGGVKLSRGNDGVTTQDILSVASDGKVTLPNNPALFTGYFESSQQTITSAGALTIAHGLSKSPSLIEWVLINTTAEHGYSVGDLYYIPANTSNSASDSFGLVVVADATNLSIRFGSAGTVFYGLSKTTGSGVTLTNANWKLILRAWA